MHARLISAGVLQRARASLGGAGFGRRAAADSVWAALDALGGRGLAVLAMMLAAHLLGPVEFGKLAAVLGTATLVSGLLADSMRYTAATQIAAAAGSDRARCSGAVTVVLWTTTIAAAICGLVMLMGAPRLAHSVFAAADVTAALEVSALYLFLEALGGVSQGILTGFRQFRALAFAGFARGALLPPLVLLMGRGGPVSVLWAFVAASAAALLARGITIGTSLRTRGLSALAPVQRAELAMLWRVSVPGLMVSLLTVPVNWLGMMLLVHSPGGYAEMGVLGAANQWFSVLLFIPGILSVVTLPHFSQHHAQGETATLRRALQLGVRLSLLAAVPPALLVAAASPWLMEFYGSGFVHGWPALALVAITAITSATLNMVLNLLGVSGHMFHVLATQVLWAVAYLTSAWLFLRLGWGAGAIAAAMLVGSLCRLAVSAYAAERVMRC